MANRKQRRASGSGAVSGYGNDIEEGARQLGALYNQGRYAEGEALARRLTKTFTHNGFFWKVLGLLIKQQGRALEALEPMKRAAGLMPTDAEACYNLGNTYKELGRLNDAEKSYRDAVSRKPDYEKAHCNLGLTLKELGCLAEAETSTRFALDIRPDYFIALNNLGMILKELGRFDEAESAYRRAIELKPVFAEAYNNLANLLQSLGRLDEAEADCRIAIGFKPNFAEAHNNLGNILKDSGYADDAVACYRTAIKLNADYAEAYNNLGNILNDLGSLNEAEESCRKAIALKPDFAGAHSNLGYTLKMLGHLNGAEASCRKAIEINPEFSSAYMNLGTIRIESGQLVEGEGLYRHALEMKPDDSYAHSNLLFLLCSMPQHKPSLYLEEALRFGEMVRSKVSATFTDWLCALNPERLKVGLVSGDLRTHPVGFFLESVLAEIDQTKIEFFAYTTNPAADDLTKRIKPHFTSWKSLIGLNDSSAAKLIHEDGVHLLIDLSGHTAHNRLPMLIWKPAPVQVTWLGYFASTGLTEIDYILTDPTGVPVDQIDQFTEIPWYLPETRLCFTPPEYDIPVSELPSLKSGHITFGCFQNLFKIGNTVLAAWSKILAALSNSRLHLQCKQLCDSTVKDEFNRRLNSYGIDPGRVSYNTSESRSDYLATHSRIDIILDTFPFPGGTTTCEALWMGVPTITLAGNTMLARQGASILTAAGLADWIAEDDDDYVARAVRHAGDLTRLAALRSGLRQQVLGSPLFDSHRFARNLEDALWEIWREKMG